MLDAARIAIRIAKDSRMYIVIDADGLFLIQDEPEMIQGCAIHFPELIAPSFFLPDQIQTSNPYSERSGVCKTLQSASGSPRLSYRPMLMI